MSLIPLYSTLDEENKNLIDLSSVHKWPKLSNAPQKKKDNEQKNDMAYDNALYNFVLCDIEG